MTDYRERVSVIQTRIAQACYRANRPLEEVTVIAVTKYIGVEETRTLIKAGIQDLGENRLQQALPKIREIEEDVRWHFIGNLQTNKVKEVLLNFSMIHSLDRLSLARELQSQCERLDLQIPCLIQVNVSGEASKSGLPPSEVKSFLEKISMMDRIKVQGLMTMAPFTENPELTRPVFRKLRELRDSLQELAPDLKHLSMGMSGDFEVAVEEGATMIRLGSVLVKP